MARRVALRMARVGTAGNDAAWVMEELCQYCRQLHSGQKCPLVRAFEYYEGGALKRVEFYAPNEYVPLTPAASPWGSVVWPPVSPTAKYG